MYTKKMHESLRRDTTNKQNVVTDLLDEIERLHNEIKNIPLANFYKADRYDTEDKHVLHLWDEDGQSYDINVNL